MDGKDYSRIAVEDLLEELKENLKQEKNLDERKFLKEKIEMLQEELKIGEWYEPRRRKISKEN